MSKKRLLEKMASDRLVVKLRSRWRSPASGDRAGPELIQTVHGRRPDWLIARSMNPPVGKALVTPRMAPPAGAPATLSSGCIALFADSVVRARS
jgi:hypothetical protein